MQAVEDMDTLRYFDVLSHELRENAERRTAEKVAADPNAVMLERGTLEGFF